MSITLFCSTLKSASVSLKMSSYAIMKKHVDAFVSHRSYPVAIISVSLSQLSGFSLIICNTARRSDWYMLIVCNSLEFELHLVGAALGKRRFTTSSSKWVRFVDLLKMSLVPQQFKKNFYSEACILLNV